MLLNRLNLIGTFLVVLAFCGLNMGIIALMSPPAVVEEVLEEEAKEILSSHIIGSHTVHVKPPVVAKFNPNDTISCILPNQELILPLLVKGVPPIHVDLVIHKNLEPEKRSLVLDQSDLIKRVHDRFEFLPDLQTERVNLFGIRVDSYGLYELKNVREVNGDEANLVQVFSLVVECPSASFFIPMDGGLTNVDGQKFDHCVNEDVNVQIKVSGVLPVSVLYLERIGKDEQVLQVETLGDSVIDSSNESVDEKRSRLTQKLHVHTSVLKTPVKIISDKVHTLKIARLTDGLGNSVEYPLTTQTELPPKNMKSSNHRIEAPANDVNFQGHEQPTVDFENCDNIKIKTDYDSRYEPAPSVNVPLVLSGSPPFALDAEFTLDGDMPSQPILMENIDAFRTSLTAHEPGTFRLLSVQDKYCKGSNIKIDPNFDIKSCTIIGVDPPTFEFHSIPIKEVCFGNIGTKIELMLSGEAPFELEYVIEKQLLGENNVETTYEREFIRKHTGNLILKPKEPGAYSYVFKKISDMNYKNIDISNQSFKQIIHPQSTAFLKSDRIVSCVGDSVNLNVYAKGVGPWNVFYRVRFNDKKVTTGELSIDQASKETSLQLDLQDGFGIYDFELLKVIDGNGCERLIQDEPENFQYGRDTTGFKSIRVEVLKNRPSVGFQSYRTIHILENGQATLPLSLSGRSPFYVRFQKDDGPVTEQTIFGNSKTLRIGGPGVYNLVSVKDSVCEGNIERKKSVTVLEIPKPTAKIDSPTTSESCQNVEDSFQIHLVGKTPFTVVYEHAYSNNGGFEREVKTVTVETEFLKIKHETGKPGKHIYTLKSISDGNYKRQINLDSLTSVTKVVHAIPMAEFLDEKEKVYQCTSAKGRHHVLSMKLGGIPPFVLQLEQKLDNQHIQSFKKVVPLNEVVKHNDHFLFNLEIDNINLMGRHEFLIDQVSDSTGCTFTFDKSLETRSTFIKIADQARINSFNKDIVCVGDLLTYSLQGTPPFTIGYSFNGKVMEDVLVMDPIFSIWAGLEGEIQILKVCNAAQCCDDTLGTDTSLKTVVKNIPTAIVGDGTDSVDDIRQGDESIFTVDFIGESPYSFTYSRIVGRGKSMQEDVFTVNDIQESKWSLKTSQEGTFRVTFVKDKYCGWPRRIASMQGANVVLK